MNNPSAPPAIEINHLRHCFKKHVALHDVSFQVQRQSLHGFVGPNGAGKTTTLKLICTLLPPQKGRIRVFGDDVIKGVKKIRRRIGFMPDHFSMYRQMTVYEYLDFFAAAYGLSIKQRDRVVSDVLTLTDMNGRKDDLINGLSRGMLQRVNLSRVLINDPDLLLLDEPASGLDPRARIELMEILQELRKMGKTIFISSHILGELADLCDSVTIIDRGGIKYCGPMEGLLVHDSKNPTYRIKLAGDLENVEQSLSEIKGVVQVEKLEGDALYRVAYDETLTNNNTLLQELISRGWTILSFTEEKKHLNQAFMDLTERGVR